MNDKFILKNVCRDFCTYVDMVLLREFHKSNIFLVNIKAYYDISYNFKNTKFWNLVNPRQIEHLPTSNDVYNFESYSLFDKSECECKMLFVRVGKGGSVYLHSDR